MKKYQIKINNMKLEIIQDDDGKFIKPYLCIEDWGKFGTALKPSFEPIIVARKPFKGSLVDNVIEYGVGGINIDECRVGNEVIKGGTMPKMGGGELGVCNYQTINAERLERQDNIGRFPANTILTYDETDFDEVCGGFPDTKSQVRVSEDKDIKQNTWSLGRKGITPRGHTDSGSASRYFYCAKASAKDRNEGLDIEIEEYVLKENTPKEIKLKIEELYEK